MKLYCFQFDPDHGGVAYPTENGVAIAENEEQAWKLFFSKVEDYKPDFKEIKADFKIWKILPLDKPAAWCGECTN